MSVSIDGTNGITLPGPATSTNQAPQVAQLQTVAPMYAWISATPGTTAAGTIPALTAPCAGRIIIRAHGGNAGAGANGLTITPSTGTLAVLWSYPFGNVYEGYAYIDVASGTTVSFSVSISSSTSSNIGCLFVAEFFPFP